ncbi:MAG TPA: hypothetical protein VL992_15390 [Tepidisphaeraceae bacterium]|nr:hypothetical protein [Tepidisphaeraceae bacterium]
MIELLDAFPDVNVQPAEYKRLLGYPRDAVPEGRARELAEWARQWYAKNGQPWVHARQVSELKITNGSIGIDGVAFTSSRLRKTLLDAEADSAVLVAVSAGEEITAQAQKLWQEEKPDEYFFLEVFGSAVVEHLTTMTGARLCAWAENRGMSVLPHYSPGYPEWDIAQQPQLLELMKRTATWPKNGIEALDSGMLRPKKSLLAVFGLTHQTERVRRITDLIPCENCSFANCQYRRVPYAKVIEPVESVVNVQTPTPAAVALDENASYIVNAKALRRWAEERLQLTMRDDGNIDAVFRYEGTTCSNMGRTILFDYHVTLGPREQGYPIRQLKCAPTPGDEGHAFMCRYMANAEHLMVAIDHEKPLLGRPLNDCLSWQRPTTGAGCYCEPASRKHKWGLVFETIHFALVQRDQNRSVTPAVRS